MIRSWICYVLAVLLVLVYAIMYHHLSGFVIWAIVTIVPPLYAFLSLLITRHGLEVFCKEGDMTLSKGETKNIPVTIRTKNRFVAGLYVVIEVHEYLGLGNITDKRQIKGRLKNGKNIINIPYVAKYSGINEIITDKIICYSAFSLFKHDITVSKKVSFLILPSYHEYDISLVFSEEEIEGEGVDGRERYSTHRVGSDPSELIDIRDYRPGDRLTGIHWKISAKKKKLMVKDLGYSLLCDNAIFFDVSYIGRKDDVEEAVTMLFYLVNTYLQNEVPVFVIWCVENDEMIYRSYVAEDTDVYELFLRIFKSYEGAYKKKSTSKLGLCDYYSREYEDVYLSNSIYLHSRNKKVDPYVLGDILNSEVVRCISI